MGVVVDFVDGLSVMLDELQETYNGRILSPQGKIIRVMPIAKKKRNGSGTWSFYGQVFVTTLMDDMILMAKLDTPSVTDTHELGDGWEESRKELDRLAGEVEALIEDRGFIVKRGRYFFSGDESYQREMLGIG